MKPGEALHHQKRMLVLRPEGGGRWPPEPPPCPWGPVGPFVCNDKEWGGVHGIENMPCSQCGCSGKDDKEESKWGGGKRGRRTIGRLLEIARHTVTRNLTWSGKKNNVANCNLSFDTFIINQARPSY